MMIVVYILIGVIVFQSILHRIERKDLYNRIMSSDLRDYKAAIGKSEKPPISRHKEVLNKWRKKGSDKE